MNINYFDINNGMVEFSQKDCQLNRQVHFPIEVVFQIIGAIKYINKSGFNFTYIPNFIGWEGFAW